MAHNHGAKAAVNTVAVAKKASKVGLGTKIIHTAAKHPILLFGVGIAAGVYLYKYRQQTSDAQSCCDE